MNRGRTFGALVATLALVPVIGASGVVQAATITVTTTADVVNGGDGVTSLREAVDQAGDGDVIDIPVGTYELACPGPEDQTNVSGDLDIVNTSITLRGPASGTATVRPATGCQERVIDIVDFGAPNAVTIEQLTITGGRPPGGGAGVNASFSTATSVTIRDSVITDNIAGDAGASDAPSGGGVYVYNAGTLVIEGSTISNNSVGSGGDAGGGAAPGWKAGGGGVAFRGFAPTLGTVTITDSTISGNTGGVAARGGGGGLWLDANVVTLTAVDIVDNTTPADPTGRASGDGAGMAIAPISGTIDLDVTITGGTIARNTIGAAADNGVGVIGGDGGGLFVEATAGSVAISGTSFDANSAGDGGGGLTGIRPGGDGGNLTINLFGSGAVSNTVTLSGVEIIDGVAGSSPDDPGGEGGGGHLRIGTSSQPGTVLVEDSTIDGNRAGDGSSGGDAGGLWIDVSGGATAGSITIDNSDFVDNVAGSAQTGIVGNGGQAGGAYLATSGAAGVAPDVVVDGSTFDGNRSGDGAGDPGGNGGNGGSGGGLVLFAAHASIDDSSFVGNSAGDGGDAGIFPGRGGNGGGMYLSDPAPGGFTITSSEFVGNATGRGGDSSTTSGASAGEGGGAYVNPSGSLAVSGSDLTANSTGRGGNGTAGGTGGSGGGLRVRSDSGADVTMSASTINGNTTGDGGVGSTTSGGSGGFGGGAFLTGAGMSVGLELVEIDGNTTGDAGSGPGVGPLGGLGGGIAADDVDGFSVVGSSISSNTTGAGTSVSSADAGGGPGGAGGGLWVAGPGSIDIDSTSVVLNATGAGGSGGPDGGDAGGDPGVDGPGGSGGGIVADVDGTFTLENSTIAGNVAGTAPDRQGDGGGLDLRSGIGTATITHATIAGNAAKNGSNLITRAGDTRFRATVLDEPVGAGGENCNSGGSTLTSLGDNVEGDADTCGFVAGLDFRNFPSALLTPLADNGGLGLTRIPRQLGPDAGLLVDRIDSGDCTLADDQRGVSRPQGDGCDIGAVEADASVAAVDDLIAVGGGTTVIDFVGNDVVVDGTLDDAVVIISRQPDDGALLLQGGTWRYTAFQDSGGFTDFDYRVCLGAAQVICDTGTVTIVPEGMSRFVGLPPARLFDTRPAQPGPGPKGLVGAGATIDVQVTGVAGVPSSGVSAVAMNVTATQVGGPGFVTAFAAGTTRPPTSNLNFQTPGDTIPNFVIVPVGADGKVSLYSLTGTHLLADVAGYFTETGISYSPAAPGADAGRFVSVSPERAFDTRPAQPAPGPKGYLAGGSTIDVQITGEAGVPDTGVAAVVMNLTVTASDGPGFVTAFPTGTTRPVASNLNISGPGQTAPNLVIVPIGSGGKISLYTLSGAHLLGDVTGYVTDGSAPRSLTGLFTPVDPDRAFDTRPSESPPGPKGLLADGQTITTQFTGEAGVPRQGAGAVVINATATQAAAPGFVTAFPRGVDRPDASTLNVTFAGQTRPNAAALRLGTGGQLDFYSLRGVHLLADVFGWFLA